MLSKTDHYFLTIAESGSLNRAAQELYVSQPSLSKYIHRLETHLGTPLFDRTVSPMQLNEAGRLYLAHLKDAMDAEQRLMSQMQELRGEIRGVLRLGIPPFCGQCYLPKVLPAFSRAFPQVSVELYEASGANIEQALVNQKIDLAILPHPITADALAYTPLFRESVLLVSRRDEKNAPVSTPDHIVIQAGTEAHFRDQPTILPHPGQKLGRIVTDYFSGIDYAPKVYTVTQNAATTLALAAAGMGVGFVPHAGLDTISEDIIGKLSFYVLTPKIPDLQFVSVTRKNTVLNTFSAAFLDLLVRQTLNT